MQSVTLSSGSITPRAPTSPPPFNHHGATGLDLMTTQAAAELLAKRIVSFWAVGGHKVEAWVIKLANPAIGLNGGSKAAWGVRTDLVNGMPSGLGRAKWERKYGRGI
jgi:methenyltetrahydromethanopterin cyclohydrolase